MRYVSAFVLLAVAGCVNLGESDCRTADWAQIGERDGLMGDRPYVEVYAHQCSRYGVQIAEKDYLDGWWVGNAEFERRTSAMGGPD